MKLLSVIFMTVLMVFSETKATDLTSFINEAKDKGYLLDTANLTKHDYISLNERLNTKNGIELLSNIYLIRNPIQNNSYTIEDINEVGDLVKPLLDLYELHPFELEFLKSGVGTVSQIFRLHFDKPVRCAEVKKLFVYNRDFTIKSFSFTQTYTYVPNERSLIPFTDLSNIQKSNTTTFFPKNYHNRGWHWAHYSLKTPMAWEITKGHKDIVHGIRDYFEAPDVLISSDIEIKTNSQGTGNWIYTNTKNNGSVVPQTELPKVGSLYSSPSHGTIVLSKAIAKMNNDNMQSQDVLPVHFVCNCTSEKQQ